jgi:hypothetical protein
MEHVMNSFSKLCLAALACAAIATGALVATANSTLSDLAPAAIGASDAGTMVALNPQPLPPFTDGDEDDYFRG